MPSSSSSVSRQGDSASGNLLRNAGDLSCYGYSEDGEEEKTDIGSAFLPLEDKNGGFMEKKISLHGWVNGILPNVFKKDPVWLYVMNTIHSCRKPRLCPASAAL